MNPHLFSVILAGGSGTRFWPASRKARPKQLQPIGPSPLPLVAATVERIAPLCPAERTLIATGVHLLDATREALPNLPDASFLGEPVARNTAPCIAWATSVVARRDPDAVVMVLPSDQHVGDPAAFRLAVEKAVASAAAGPITTVGIAATRPETGYGYLEVGEDLGGGVFRVRRFVEKPTRELAEQYLASGRHYWNSGMFFFRASAMLAAVREHLPAVADGLDQIARAAPADVATETARAFERFASVSIDYAVMEKMAEINVVPASFGWSDLGSWQSAWELAPKDEHGNAAPEHAVLCDARGNLVRALGTHSRRRVIALVGVSDLCVIETDDATLVIPRDRAQDVRKVIELLEARGRRDLL